jgi:hypothetical protein
VLGIAKLVLNVPVAVVVTVVILLPSNFIVTLVVAAKLDPVTVTVAPGAALVGDNAMDIDTVALTVNVALPILPISSLADTI